MQATQATQIALAALGVVVAYEHFARMRNFPPKYQISHQLDVIAEKFVQLWKNVGVLIARASGIYRHLGLDKLGSTCIALVNPIFVIVGSPTSMLFGYFDYASNNLGKTMLGTAMLGVAGYYGYLYFKMF